ncbi:SctC family type III secretion system outer membrane ring subunit AscC [Aeromonas allosaccharophila]|uniref:SctC family type III secretion system outer membrane ring subunit AscC n=1 Tax=Aeromonas allosaccharophila TaxID=656 RepID=UPI001872F5BE|nr:SctC family type III secretion system outer membrane ring subunit AscC [Aeromonas allosaccharophila]MCE9953194.1 SctC family type III secretion system outer membrane ring subunit AscC [Aeromonas allosaccharophila]
METDDMAPLSVQPLLRPLLWICFAVMAWLRPAMAQELDWVPMPYSYVAEGESLRDVLVNFGANYEVSVVVSDKVNDQVNGQFEHDEPLAFLQQLASLYNLVWYYDGNVLYVFKNSEVQSRLINLEQTGAAELKQALQRAGIWEPRFGWRPDADNRLVYVSGPPRYLELIEQTALALEQQTQLRSEKTGPLAIEIFPLKYASATDRSIQYRDTDVEAPGLATILARLLSDAGVQMVNGEGNKKGAAVTSGQAIVQADPSLNAVIVRDTPERMAMYGKLIAALDKPAARIEVALSIIDINAEDLSQLGVDWRVGIRTGSNQQVIIKTTGDRKGIEGGAALGSLVDSKGLDYLLARVNLLESEGNAQVVSRPTLLTQENTQAVIDHSETYYVKISGERVAELQGITYGTMLRMTPRVIQMGDRPEISLSLHIEDGGQKVNSTGIDGIPTISRTVVDTIARVSHGQSLLIGGIYRDEINENLSKVPFLGDIPYLGALFRSKDTQTKRSVRLFIIEPRLIDDGIAHYLALGNGQDLRAGLLGTDELSNQSLSLGKVLGGAQCQPLAAARDVQQLLRQGGKSSSLIQCRMGNELGWRLVEMDKDQKCTPAANWCVQAGNEGATR